MIKKMLICFFVLGLSTIAFAAGQETLTAVTKKSTGDAITQIRDGFNTELAKQQRMNTELYTGLSEKEVKAVVQTSAPADTTIDWYDTDQEPGVLILKRHNGTTWVRASSHGVQYLSNCASITAGMCVDTDDGKLYYHNGSSVVEVGTGSGSYPSAGIALSTGSAWGPSLSLDTDLSSVSASDDSIPSAKATKAAIDALPTIVFGTGLTITEDTPSAGTDTVSITPNTYQPTIIQAADCSTYTTLGQLCVQY